MKINLNLRVLCMDKVLTEKIKSKSKNAITYKIHMYVRNSSNLFSILFY